MSVFILSASLFAILTLATNYLVHGLEMRLSSGHEGRLEIFRSRGWSAMCDKGWNMKAANVACRAMGFLEASSFLTGLSNKNFGELDTWVTTTTCTGRERRFSKCRHTTGHRTRKYCSVNTQVGLICKQTSFTFNVLTTASPVQPTQTAFLRHMEIRNLKLERGRYGETKLKVDENDNVWKSVCGDNWDMVDAIVACRELNLGHVKSFDKKPMKQRSAERSMSNIKCTGDERKLSECSYDIATCTSVVMLKCTKSAPDLITDLKTLQKSIKLVAKKSKSLDCAKEEMCLSSSAYNSSFQNNNYRRMLTFSANVYNQGTADLRPPDKKNLWEWHSCHQHYHSVSEFASYQLLSEDGRQLASGHKVSFCLEDTECDYGIREKYSCSGENRNKGAQGISVGCSDVYGRELDCQWIDVTDVEPGSYTLKIVLNPTKLFSESNYDNNETRCPVVIREHSAYFRGKCVNEF